MKTDLIYGVEDRPPFKEALFAALQHLLAIFVAIITPPLIIASALKLDVEKTSFLVSMSLFASGVSTFIFLVGVTAYPPQLSGLSTSFPIHRAASLTKDRINCILLAIG